MKKIVSFIISITICTSLLGAEFKEITPLENEIVSQNNTATENKKEDIKPIVQEEKNIEASNPVETSTEVETPTSKERIEDLGIKREDADGKVYAGKETTPYTGKFALFLGDIIEYTETYSNGILNGPKTWFSNDGKVVLEENYENNKIEGEQKAYYENGNIKSIVDYKNGRIVKVEALAKDGTVLHQSDLSKGTGLWKYFWENGNVLEEGNYKNWKKDGKWVKYRENGDVDVTTIYKNGKLVEQIWG